MKQTPMLLFNKEPFFFPCRCGYCTAAALLIKQDSAAEICRCCIFPFPHHPNRHLMFSFREPWVSFAASEHLPYLEHCRLRKRCKSQRRAPRHARTLIYLCNSQRRAQQTSGEGVECQRMSLPPNIYRRGVLGLWARVVSKVERVSQEHTEATEGNMHKSN